MSWSAQRAPDVLHESFTRVSGRLGAMPELRCNVLGALEVHVDGQPRRVPPGRQRAVLTCLLLDPGRSVSADQLIEAAWGQDLPKDPARALRTVLSRLRATLGHEAISLGPAGYRLADVTLDVTEFEELVRHGSAAEPHRAAELLGRALGLWRGPAYGEYADASFARASAERLARLGADAVEALATARVQLGQSAAAVSDLEHLLEAEPFRDHAVGLLVTALYHAGRQAEALDRLRQHRTLLRSELGLDPSPDLVALEAKILGHSLAPAVPDRGVPTWLDTSTAFVGREDELADLAVAVTDNRLTVVTGPGGVGKSRLAAQVLPRLHKSLGVPVTVTELAPTRTGQVAITVADALGLRTGAEPAAGSPQPTGARTGDPGAAGLRRLTDELVEYLGAAPRLLVLDNCEHVLEEAADLVSAVIRRCPEVRVLGTSRRRLGIRTELVLPLAPLGVPARADSIGRQGAAASVRLFGDRVRRLRPSFAVTEQNTADVAELCRRCEGLPLALELAASRTATSGLGGVLARLPADLVGEEGLRAVVSWSYDLLEPEQQELLQCLTVCAGDVTQESLAGLMEHVPGWTAAVGPALAELVESSLVTRHEVGGQSFFRLLEMVRLFAAGRLLDAGRAEHVEAAHGVWVRDEVGRIRDDWDRLDGAVVGARLTARSTEVGAALHRALAVGDLVLASQISCAVARCLHWTPALAVRDLMIEVGEQAARHADPLVAGGIAAAAFGAAEQGSPGRARNLATTALEVSRDRDSTALAHLALGVTAMYAGDLAGSARWVRSLSADPALAGEANCTLALIAAYSGDLDAARQHAEVALVASGSDASAAFARYAAGEVAVLTDPARGAELFAEAAGEADRVGAEQVSRVSRLALFALLVRDGRHEDAVVLGLRLCADLRRLGAWTQAWTLVRMIAELLSATEHWSEAAFLLGAAKGAAEAPPLVGQDIQRYAELQDLLSAHLSAGVLAQLEPLAASTPRAQVLSRAEQALRSAAAR